MSIEFPVPLPSFQEEFLFSNEETAIDLARKNNHLAIVEHLQGIVDAKNIDGQTAKPKPEPHEGHQKNASTPAKNVNAYLSPEPEIEIVSQETKRETGNDQKLDQGSENDVGNETGKVQETQSQSQTESANGDIRENTPAENIDGNGTVPGPGVSEENRLSSTSVKDVSNENQGGEEAQKDGSGAPPVGKDTAEKIDDTEVAKTAQTGESAVTAAETNGSTGEKSNIKGETNDHIEGFEKPMLATGIIVPKSCSDEGNVPVPILRMSMNRLLNML